MFDAAPQIAAYRVIESSMPASAEGATRVSESSPTRKRRRRDPSQRIVADAQAPKAQPESANRRRRASAEGAIRR